MSDLVDSNWCPVCGEPRGVCRCGQMSEAEANDKAAAVVAEFESNMYVMAGEIARLREDLGGAQVLVAKMHAAAVGEVRGPIRGVVEDVEDLRAAYLRLCGKATTGIITMEPGLKEAIDKMHDAASKLERVLPLRWTNAKIATPFEDGQYIVTDGAQRWECTYTHEAGWHTAYAVTYWMQFPDAPGAK